MKHLPLISSICSTPRHKLYMAIAAQILASAGAQATPNGGTIVGGDAVIEQLGVDTTITQTTNRLAIDWESFNIAAEERVQFIQPDSSSVALNRILGNEASQIFGRLDANGHVILMNPNGVLFGEGATVNVGGLVASGLNINADDFMNGEFIFQAVEGTDGAVINNGIINAATGGNVALLGKQIDNQGLISAKLGSVSLAAGKEAVLTFDTQGMLGVRVSKEVLQSELGVDAAVANSGEITAEGGRILMTGSVSQDIFSQAVNADGLNAKASVVMHEDGSFTLGGGADVVNTGTISTSSELTDAGQIVVLGENVNTSGAILANSKTANASGNIEIHARDTALLSEQSQTHATNDGTGSGGQIKILGDRVGILDQSKIDTSGTSGGGDINIGGGFQGKQTQLRNATRTVVGKDTLIEANAISEGDGGDVIVWANETTSFTGEINVRGGELGGDGGFVEVSGKENLRFLGSVDRTAVRGENGTLLLDPEIITIVKESEQPPANGDEELLDTEVLFADRQDVGELRISDAAISTALSLGNVVLQASREIGTYNPGNERVEIISNSSNSLIMESGGTIILSTLNLMLGSGSLILSSGLLECGGIPCWVEVANPQIADRINLSELDLVTTGDLIVRSRGSVDLFGIDISVTNLDLASYKGVTINTLYDDASIDAAGTMDILAGSIFSPEAVVLPSGQIYTTPFQTVPYQGEVIVGSVRLNGDINVSGETNIRSSQGISAELSSRLNLIGDVFFDADGSIRFLRNGDISTSIFNPGGDVYLNAGGNIEFFASTDYATSEFEINEFILPEDSTSNFTWESEGNIYFEELGLGQGDIALAAVGDVDLGRISTRGSLTVESTEGGISSASSINLGATAQLSAITDINLGPISSDGDLIVESALGSISSFSALEIAGNTTFSAAGNIELSEGFSLNSDFGDFVLSSDSVVSIRSLVPDQQIQINAAGDFTINATTLINLVRGVYNVGNLNIVSTDGSLFANLVELNSGGSVDINLEKGVIGSGSDMVVNAGSFSASATDLGMELFELNMDSSTGSGEVVLIATRPDASIVSYGEIWLPQINPSGNFNTTNVTINAQTENAGIYAQMLPDGAPRFNVGGSIAITSLGDVELPEINMESVDGNTANSLTVSTPGKIVQLYDIYTGGANFSAAASEFEFAEAVQINTDFSNPIQDALFGTGNVSIQSTSDESELLLPGITTQTDCMEIIACGTLNISAESATNKGSLRIFGAADFSVNGVLQLKRAAILESGDSIALENAFGGILSVNAAYADLSLSRSVLLGEWNLTSTSEASVIAMPGYDGDFDIVGNQPLNVAGTLFLGGSAVELKNADTRIAQLQLSTNRANIEYSGDLELRSSYLFGDESGEASYFKVGGDLNLLEDGYITGGFLQSLPILEVDPTAPIIFDVGGNIALLGERNRLSSIQILNAQNVDISNNGELTLDGINAENLTLNVLGDIEQTAVLNIRGATNINASVGANINLLDPLNDFNSLSVQAIEPAIINIADANSISLADINLNGASQGGALSVTAAAITQEESGRILLQDGTRLNLQADYITLGANGSATVDIYGSTLNGVFTRDLNIQGAVRGGEGVAGTGVAGFYFNGSVEDNFFEVAEGASITGDFISGSKIHLGDGNDTASLAGDVAIPIEGGAGQDTFLIAAPNLSVAQILGNEGQDILVGPDANNVWAVTENGEGGLSHELAVSNFGGIETIRGGSQADDFIVGSLTAALQIDGGGGLDSLSANLSDASTNNQWIVDGVNSGSLNEFLSFTSIENLIGNDGADTVTFAEGAQIGNVSTGLGDDIFTLATDVTTGLLDAGEGQDTLNLNGLNSIYTYLNELIGGDGSYTTAGFEIENNEGGSKTIVGVDGYDAEWIIDGEGNVTINALQGGTTETNRFSGVTRVEGASGDDTFVLLAGGQLADQIVGGQGGIDSLVADTGLINSWLIDGQNSGQVSFGEDGLQKFESVSNLIGGLESDLFELNAGGEISGSIAGRGGVNTLRIANDEQASQWLIGPEGSSVTGIASFIGIQELIGNSNDDLFLVSGPQDTISIDGRGGSNWIDIQSSDVRLDIELETVWIGSDALSFNNISRFSAGGAAQLNSIIGWDSDTEWQLESAGDSGSAVHIGDGTEIKFEGFRNIRGGAGSNAVVGLNESGQWSLDTSDRVWIVYEESGEVRLANMNILIGGSADDHFEGSFQNIDQIDGGGGQNSLLVKDTASEANLEWVLNELSSSVVAVDAPQTNNLLFANIQRLGEYDSATSGSTFIIDSLKSDVIEIVGGVGGEEPNTVSFVNLEGPLIFDHENMQIKFSNIDRFEGNGDQSAFVGGNEANIWRLSNDGVIYNDELNLLNFARLQGGDGDDLFLVDTTLNSPTSALLDGGAGTNTLIANRDNTLNNTWTINGVNSGTLNTTVQFSNIQDLQGNDGVDTFTFADNSVIGNINAGAGDDIFVLANNITAGILDGGEGTDTLNLNGMNSIYTYLNELIGGDGNYTASSFEVEINEGGSKTIVGVDGYGAEWVVDGDGSVEVTARQGAVTVINRFSGVTRLQGASGPDTFILQDGYIADGIVGSQDGADTLVADTGVQNDWSLDGVNAGTVSAAGSEREQLFEAIANLVGGSDNDVFNILSGADFDGTINGGGGDNSLAVLDPSATSVWTIATTNDVRIQSLADTVSQITFSDIQALIGNTNEDVLDLSAVAGSVDVEQQLATGSGIPNFSIQGFDTFISNGGGFLGSNSNATWILNELSEISYEDQSGIAHQLKFSGFQNIYGGTGEDYFRIDGRWFADAGAIYAGTLSESLDTAELNISGTSAWSFNSNDSTAVYTDIVDPGVLFSATRTEALNTLADSSSGAFYLSGIERNLGGEGDDVFFVYGDSDLYSPYVDGRGGNDYLLAFNWGTPQDLVWNVTENFGGNINNAVVFQNFENLKSHNFIETRPDEHVSHFHLAEDVSIGVLVGDTSNTIFNIGSGALVGAILDNGGVDTINVSDGANSWLLEESGGSLNATTFAGIEILNGGSGSDEFIVTSPATQVTQINGGAGSNSLTAFDQDNSWTLSATGGTLNDSLQFSDIAGLIGGAGVDTFFVDDDSVAVDLDGGLGSNQLIASGIADNTWLIDGANAGSLNSTMTFERIENLDGNAGNDTFTLTANSAIGNINAGAGDDTFVLANNITAGILDGGEGQDTLDRGGLNSIMTYLREVIGGDAVYAAVNIEEETSAGGSTTVVGVDGYDAQWSIAGDGIINVTATGSDGIAITNQFTGVTRAEGGSGTDEFILLDGGLLADGIVGNGEDSLQGSDTTNTWAISSANGGQLLVEENSTSLIFQGIANLVGGSGSDFFEFFEGGSITGSIHGGAGADTLAVSDSSVTNNWQLGPMNSVGLVAPFEQIETLIGNGNDDTFTFGGATDVISIEGGAGTNTVLWMAGDAAVNLAIKQINNEIAFANVNSFVVEPENNNLLIGEDQENIWTLTDTNTGTVNEVSFIGFNTLQGGSGQDVLQATDADNRWSYSDVTSSSLNDTLLFSGMDVLMGGAGADEFRVLAASNPVSFIGGDGDNSLFGAAIDNRWAIEGDNLGSLNESIAFENIQSLYGNDGSDTFTFAANTQIGNINAGAGDDIFILANNITAGILDGDDGEDTLDRGGINTIITYLREVIGGDAIYTTANIEAETSAGGSTTVVAVDGYDARWLINGEGSVSVLVTDEAGVAQTNDFADVTRLQGGSGVDEFILQVGGAIAEGIQGSGDDSLIASDTTNTWTISSENAGELAVAEGTTLVFQGIADLIGGSGADLFNIVAGGAVTGLIDGGAGADHLVVSDSNPANIWQLGIQNSVDSVARFQRVESVTGNAGDDRFVFNAATDVTFIDGNTGSNALLWNAGDLMVNFATGSLNDAIQFSAIRALEADASATNTLIGADIDNVWTLDGAATGTVANAESTVSFSGFQNLVGGAAGDEFTLAADAAGFSSFNGMEGADTITAADQANQWLLDAEGGELNGLRFANVEALVGGAFADDFVLVDAISQAQSVDGGAGANRLTGFDQANTWDITSDNAGSLTGLASFSNIQTLIGGAQADTFTLAAGVNLSEIYGGAGNDTFVIGEGVVADNLFGDGGDDSFDVDLGLVLSGVLDGGTGGEVDGDYINLSKYTVLDATADLETVLGFAFRNFERIDEPNNQGVYFGGNGTNFWYITGANEGRLEIRDGDNAGVYEFTGVHSLLGGEGEDIFIFANDSAAVSTLIDGGEGAGANTLDLSAQGLINEWLLSGANSGTVSNTSNTSGNVFTNIAYLIGGAGQDLFDLHTGGSIAGAIDGGLGADELRVSVEQTSNWQLDADGHSVTGIASFANIETLTGSAGTDNFNILAEVIDVTRLRGGAGSDAVNFLYETPVTVDLATGLAGGLRIEEIEELSSVDAGSSFVGVDTAATWTIDGADRGSIRYLLEPDEDVVNVAFVGFGNIAGGSGDDQFLFAQDGSLSGGLDGGSGYNTVDLQEIADEIHVAAAPGVALPEGVDWLDLMAVDHLVGNGRTWLYGAGDRSYTWTIDGARSGQMTSTLVDDSNRVLAFENLTAIRGGEHDDIFRVIAAAPLISLDGGLALTADLVDYSLVNGNLRINLADALGGQNGVITGVEGIRGNNAGADSLHSAELVGPDSGATWSIGNVNGDGLVDGINDGEVVFGEQTITFIDFNVLTGGAGTDVFNQTAGVILGTLNGGAGDDIFNIGVSGANPGTRLVGGAGNDSLFLRGGDAAGLMTYTANPDGGEFDYSLADIHYKVSHQEVENLNDNTLAETLDIRGSNAAETFSLANGRFWVNGGNAIQYSNKRDIAVRSGINDTIEIADNLVVDNALTLANGTVIANDPSNSSITATDLILDSTRDVGLSSARLRTSIDNLWLRNSAGDTYLQEQNGLNLAEFSSNGVFDLLLLNGNLTNSAPVLASDVFRIVANNGDITLSGANQLRDDVALTGNRVELHNASTLTLVEVNAEDLYLRTQRGIEGDGPLTVSGLTDIDAGGDVLLDFATNDFNRVRVTNAVNLTLVDQNAIELLDINASGTVVVRSTNTVTLNDSVTGANGVDVSSDIGSVDQNGSITTNSGAVVVSAGNGEVNLGEDARIVSNGGSVSINAGAGNVNMGGDTRIAANGGDVNIIAADSVVVAEVISSGNVSINAGSGSVSDGNGGATNVSAGGLQSSSNTGFGSDDALETNVGSIDITTNTGNVAVSNTGNVAVDKVSTGQGDVSLVNQGNVELGGGSVVAENGANGGSVNIDVSKGSVSQSGSTSVPAVKGGGVVVINAPDGAIGEGGGLRVDAPFVEIIAAIKAGDIFVNPGADKIEYFSGSFKFDDQLLAVEPLEDINPAIFANVKSYFFNDISLLLPRDQLYDEDDEE